MIGVVGLGIVGLTTALGFAEKGKPVVGFDIDSVKRRVLEDGRIGTHEPELEDVLNRQRGRHFHLAERLDAVVSQCDTIFFCVGTPAGPTGAVDLTALHAAVTASLKRVPKGRRTEFVIKSTVPPPTTRRVIPEWIEAEGLTVGEEIGLANNPEFLREGHAWRDFIEPDRVVIGEYDRISGEAVAALYASFPAPIFRVSLTTAEFVKYLSNTMLATMISFSNEMAMIAQKVGDINVAEAFRLMHMDRRWSGSPAGMTSYAYPGCGFGGYCLPKDTAAMAAAAESHGAAPMLLRDVLATNRSAKEALVARVEAVASRDTRIGVLGLAFKPNSDDVRDSPAGDIVRLLLERGFRRLTAYDPAAMENFRAAYRFPIAFAESLEAAVNAADVLVITTAWSEFNRVPILAGARSVVDGRYFLDHGRA